MTRILSTVVSVCVVASFFAAVQSQDVCDFRKNRDFLKSDDVFEVSKIGFKEQSVPPGEKDRLYLDQVNMIESRIKPKMKFVVTKPVGNGDTGKLLHFKRLEDAVEPVGVEESKEDAEESKEDAEEASADGIVVKFLFQKSGTKEKREKSTEEEAMYYNFCFAMGLRCPVSVPATILHPSGCKMRVIFKQFVIGNDLKKSESSLKDPEFMRDMDFLVQRLMIFLVSPSNQFEEKCRGRNKVFGPLLCSRLGVSADESVSGPPIFLTDFKDANFMIETKRKQAWLVDFEILTIPRHETTTQLFRAMMFTQKGSQLDWIHPKSVLGRFYHFQDYFECPVKAPNVRIAGSKGCFEYGMNVLYKRQNIKGFEDILIEKQPVKMFKGMMSGIGTKKPRYLKLNVKDVHDASLTYYKRESVEEEESAEEKGSLNLRCGQCEVHLPKMNGINDHHITVINNHRDSQFRSFTFDIKEESVRWDVYSQLRMACCQSKLMASGILTIGAKKHYFEKYHSIDENMDVIFYGLLKWNEFKGFTATIELNKNDWTLPSCALPCCDTSYIPKRQEKTETVSPFHTRLHTMNSLKKFSIKCHYAAPPDWLEKHGRGMMDQRGIRRDIPVEDLIGDSAQRRKQLRAGVRVPNDVLGIQAPPSQVLAPDAASASGA